MRHIILSFVACLALPHFFHYFLNGTIFIQMLLNIKCVFWFSLQIFYEIFLILRIIERDIVINVYRSSCKIPVILVRFYWNVNFLDRFLKTTQRSNVMKICQWRLSCSMTWLHRQTDMMMLMSLFALFPTCLTTAHTKIVSQHEFIFQ
jgi:hypothetical protein